MTAETDTDPRPHGTRVRPRRRTRLVVLLAVAGVLCLVGWALLPPRRPPETLLIKLRAAADTGRLADLLSYANAYVRAEGNYERFRPTTAEEQIIVTLAQWARKPTYTTADLDFLQRMRLYSTLSARAADTATDPLLRARAIFDWVVDHVAPEPAGPDRSPADALLDGLATPEQLAWTCAVLLAAVDVPAALVEGRRQGTAADTEPGHILLGVLLDSEIALYDASAGVPIEARAADGAFSPVTLREASAHPALVDGVRIDGLRYPFAGHTLRQGQVWLAYEPERLIPRTRVLVELAGPPAGVGSLYRDYVADYRLWMRALTGTMNPGPEAQRVQVSVWPYPFEVYGRQERGVTTRPTTRRRPWGLRRLADDRRRALVGAFDEARRRLVERLQRAHLSPEEREATAFFIAECDLDAGRLEQAREALAAYLADWPAGAWRDQAILLDARAAERLGRNDEALAGYLRVTGPRALRARRLAFELRRRLGTATRPAASP